jgi:phospholipid N-methyltransferase
MIDAPETLWVDPSSMDDLNMYVGHDSRTMDYLNMDVEYTRTDISQAYIDAIDSLLMFLSVPAQARIKQLEAALEEIEHMGFDMPATLDLTDAAWSQRRAGMMQHIARAILKDTTNE